jgi:hypothetical protein
VLLGVRQPQVLIHRHATEKSCLALHSEDGHQVQ